MVNSFSHADAAAATVTAETVEDAKAVTAEKAMTADADVTKNNYMKVAIVILNWNTKGFLEKFLPGLIDSVKHIDGVEVIVADNASTDGSIDLMKDKFPDTRTIVFDKNYGFTGGYNRALREIKAEYYVLLNSDVEVTEGWLEPMIAWMDNNPECGVCGPKLYDWNNKNKYEYAGGVGGHIDRHGYPFCRGRIMGMVEDVNHRYDNLSNKVFWVGGACFMVRSGLFHDMGGFDERFFAHMEEIDLCWRIQLVGFSICVITDSVVYHVGGGTLPTSSPFKLFLNYRNNLLMLNKNGAKTLGLMLMSMGISPETAAAVAMDKADRDILTRISIDIMSSFVYLVTFRFRSFLTVYKAIREYWKMRDDIKLNEMIDFMQNSGKIEINGIYIQFVLSRAIFYRWKVFDILKDKDFIKFHIK